MLKSLYIKNFAIIEQLELDFSAGMTALTGETGAGKSILLGALGLVLGDRADNTTIRQGVERAEITATFDITLHQGAQAWLSEQSLDDGEECIIRRVINRDAASKTFINSSPVTLQALKELGEMLVTIHGQHEHQALLKRDIQRQRLDDFGGQANRPQETAARFSEWQQTQQRLQQLQLDDKQRNNRLEALRFQHQEFEQLQLQEDEWSNLQAEHQRLAHASSLIEVAGNALNTLYDEEQSVHSIVSQHLQSIQDASSNDAKLIPIAESLNNALIQVDDAADQLRGYYDSLNLDPKRLQWLDERMGAIYSLARKHRAEPEQLLEVVTAVEQELNDLEHADEHLSKLNDECTQLREAYLESAKALTNYRKKTAATLSKAVSEAMQQLGMAGGQFHIEINSKNFDEQSGEGFSANGLDVIEFQVAANAGQATRSLAKVASGGELSRISLAIQIITTHNEPIPTLIFDEVDAGVGGGVAEVVGSHLRQLGNNRQVFCVTHLPQVAAQAHSHFKIEKQQQSDKADVQTAATQLSAKQRIDEIARMLGGIEITEATLTHASEMISKNKETEIAD